MGTLTDWKFCMFCSFEALLFISHTSIQKLILDSKLQPYSSSPHPPFTHTHPYPQDSITLTSIVCSGVDFSWSFWSKYINWKHLWAQKLLKTFQTGIYCTASSLSIAQTGNIWSFICFRHWTWEYTPLFTSRDTKIFWYSILQCLQWGCEQCLGTSCALSSSILAGKLDQEVTKVSIEIFPLKSHSYS